MRAVAELLSGVGLEVMAVPADDLSGWHVVLVVGDVHEDQADAELAADVLAVQLSEALEADLAAPLHVCSERMPLITSGGTS
ncbi:hypothetical protein [uncultured Modestobacter sp.]|uniref:hypothetical protein n=1 Tax=uncultured Modestobacter sp. TaxID=380048 RepID=UPI00261E7D35|nr:hypothetical protein [uncultured Modestobacter sp.]